VVAPALTRTWSAVADVTVVRGGALGDFVVALPALRSLAGPNRRLHLVGNAAVVCALAPELFVSTTSLDDAAWAGLFDDSASLPGACGGAIALLRDHADVVERLRQRGFEPVLGATSFPPPDSAEHVATHLLRAVAPAARADVTLERPSIHVAPARRPRPYAVIHPGSGSPRKNWPSDRFAELARRVERAGLEPIVLAGPADEPVSIGGRPTTSGLGLRELASLLAGATLYVGNDSGASHVAGAVGAPTVAVFGPTRALRWRPLGPRVVAVEPPHRCDLCRSAEERPVDCGCLLTVEVDAVAEAAAQLIGLLL
jgi:heptosyltransferase-3